MTGTFDEPPDENEQYEDLDESLDVEDLPGHGGSADGARDLDVDVVVDSAALEEAGAQLEDADQMSVLDGGMDDPDGPGRSRGPDDAGAGWDLDPVGAEGDAFPGDVLADVPALEQDPELEIVTTDALDMEEIPDDAPGAGSARW